MLDDTKLGTIADKYGFYAIHNIPPGGYDVRAKMLGYTTIIMKNVTILADYNHEINFELVSEALELREEIVIVAERPLIQKDYPYTSQFLNFSDINRKLPIDNIYQAIKLQTTTVNGHVRGGRNYDVLYMIDGLSIHDPMFREISTFVPLSAISDMAIHSGGFNAEYGQAMSGAINLTTKEGKEKTEGFFKIYTDNWGVNIKNDNLRQMELSLGGPLLVSFGGPMYDLNYFISGTMNFDNRQFSNVSEVPIPITTQNYHYASKVSFKLWNKIKIVFQNLSSSWQVNSSSDPLSDSNNESSSIDQKKDSQRINFTFIHTLNPKSFYTVSVGRDLIKKQVYNRLMMNQNTGLDKSNHLLSTNLSYNWNDIVDEKIYFLKAIYYYQFSSSDLINLGVHYNLYHIFMNNLSPSLSPDSLDLLTFPQEQSFDKLGVNPYTVAIFAQDRIEYERFLLTIGLRFDYFNPRFVFPTRTIISSEDTLHLASRKGKYQFQFSPRTSLSFPLLSKYDRIHINYAWYFQTPPLYYFYLNSILNIHASHPLFGNSELDAEKTEAFEAGYQRALGLKTVVGVTFFVKKIENLVNTKSYFGEKSQANYTQYENIDRASIKGLEIFLERRPGNNNFYGKIGYTYCRANGSGSFPLENYYRLIQNFFSYPAGKSYPLAWDQRHKISCNVSYTIPKNIEINLLARLNSPLPILDQNYNIIGRNDWRNYIDFRVIKSYKLFKGNFSPYLEILNILDDQEQDNIINPYYLGDYNYLLSGFSNYQYEYGRRVRMGLMINF